MSDPSPENAKGFLELAERLREAIERQSAVKIPIPPEEFIPPVNDVDGLLAVYPFFVDSNCSVCKGTGLVSGRQCLLCQASGENVHQVR